MVLILFKIRHKRFTEHLKVRSLSEQAYQNTIMHMQLIFNQIIIVGLSLTKFYNNEALGIPVSSKTMALFPCSPKTKSWFSMFPVPQSCLCSPVPLNFRPLFPCSPEKNCPCSPVPQNPWEGLNNNDRVIRPTLETQSKFLKPSNSMIGNRYILNFKRNAKILNRNSSVKTK